MRWFEVLAAALFTLDVTGSGFDVALVSAARTMPMFVLGAFSGVVTEAVNRKLVLVAGQVVTCAASASVALLAWSGVLVPWHVALAALVAGVVWSTEMATRRRMVGECVEPRLVSRALALDTMSNSFTRLLGPICAGVVYQRLGLAGAFAASACFYAFAALLASGGGASAGLPAAGVAACAAGAGGGRAVCARRPGDRRRAGGDHRDEPAGISLCRAGGADRAAGVSGFAHAGGGCWRRRRRLARSWAVRC